MLNHQNSRQLETNMTNHEKAIEDKFDTLQFHGTTTVNVECNRSSKMVNSECSSQCKETNCTTSTD